MWRRCGCVRKKRPGNPTRERGGKAKKNALSTGPGLHAEKLRIFQYRRYDTALAAIPFNEAQLSESKLAVRGSPTPHDV